MNACNRLFAFLPRGLRSRRWNAPAWLSHPLVRAAWYVILFATLATAVVLRVRFHLFTIVTVMGILLCRAFPAAVWCNGLCPWGVLFQCGSRIPKLRWKRGGERRHVRQALPRRGRTAWFGLGCQTIAGELNPGRARPPSLASPYPQRDNLRSARMERPSG